MMALRWSQERLPAIPPSLERLPCTSIIRSG